MPIASSLRVLYLPQKRQTMASDRLARIADDMFMGLGSLLDDKTLCEMACAERLCWDRSASERQMREDEQQQILELMGRAECHEDCERVTGLLHSSSIAAFVVENFWHSDGESQRFSDVLFHLEFRCSRQNLPLLRRTLKAFLRDLHGLADLHVLNETLTFREEYTGERLYDNGAQHRADIALRFYDKVRRVIA